MPEFTDLVTDKMEAGVGADEEVTCDSQTSALCPWPADANLHRDSRAWGEGEVCGQAESCFRHGMFGITAEFQGEMSSRYV